MYYRRKSYPKSGHADVPDDLWEEFQRIRGHMSSVDQNNIEAQGIGRDKVAPPNLLDRTGVSDFVDTSGDFLYDERGEATDSATPFLTLSGGSSGRWYDLARKGIVLKTRSRGDSPWLVGGTVAARVWEKGTSSFMDGNKSNRGNLSLRLRSSSTGMSPAESVGGFNMYVRGCCISTVSCFVVRGGAIQFSPVVLFNQIFQGDDPEEEWGIDIVYANIFAVGLYR
tara:strand:+ start:854 stop:1528 length:675 start_codon:yes stop_codon:yes gene_type:complete